jgi:hypothetical protein
MNTRYSLFLFDFYCIKTNRRLWCCVEEITLSKQKLLRELYELELRLEAENSALIVCQTTERDLQQQKKFLTEESANLSSLFAQITQTESNLVSFSQYNFWTFTHFDDSTSLYWFSHLFCVAQTTRTTSHFIGSKFECHKSLWDKNLRLETIHHWENTTSIWISRHFTEDNEGFCFSKDTTISKGSLWIENEVF